MVNYKEAVKRPFSDWKKLGIGFLLLVIPIVNIITGFIARGFFLECGKNSMNKKQKLPEWKNLWALFWKGVLASVIGIIYFIPALILMGIAASSVFLNILDVSKISEITEELVLNTIISNIGSLDSLAVIFAILLVLATYVAPMAVLHYMEKWRFKEAFKFKSVFRKAFTSKYFLVILFIFAYSVMVSLVSLIFVVIPVIGPLIGGALLGYVLGVTSFIVLGEVYKEIK